MGDCFCSGLHAGCTAPGYTPEQEITFPKQVRDQMKEDTFAKLSGEKARVRNAMFLEITSSPRTSTRINTSSTRRRTPTTTSFFKTSFFKTSFLPPEDNEQDDTSTDTTGTQEVNASSNSAPKPNYDFDVVNITYK